MNVRLRDGGNEAFVQALGFGNRFVRLSNVLLKTDRVAKLAFAFTLEFLEAPEIGLGGGEMPFLGGEFDGGIFAGF
jgi:hypothetical protein